MLKIKIPTYSIESNKNAAEAMSAIDPHKRKIDIKISQEKDVVSLSVKDYGIGIEPELLNKIFSHGFYH